VVVLTERHRCHFCEETGSVARHAEGVIPSAWTWPFLRSAEAAPGGDAIGAEASCSLSGTSGPGTAKVMVSMRRSPPPLRCFALLPTRRRMVRRRGRGGGVRARRWSAGGSRRDAGSTRGGRCGPVFHHPCFGGSSPPNRGVPGHGFPTANCGIGDAIGHLTRYPRVTTPGPPERYRGAAERLRPRTWTRSRSARRAAESFSIDAVGIPRYRRLTNGRRLALS
jgi:hypothetical protein